MGARVLHVQQLGDAPLVATVRFERDLRTGQVVRLLSLPERQRRQDAFAVICERRGAMARIADAWAVSPTVVRKVRDGLAPLTDERIRALPDAQRRHLFEVLADTAQLSLPGFE